MDLAPLSLSVLLVTSGSSLRQMARVEVESVARRQSDINCSLHLGLKPLTFTSLARTPTQQFLASILYHPRGFSLISRESCGIPQTKLILIHYNLNVKYGLCRQSFAGVEENGWC